MGNSIPDAAAFLSAAHHRTLQKKVRDAKSPAKAPGGHVMLVRIGIVVVVLFALVGGVNAVMLAILH